MVLEQKTKTVLEMACKKDKESKGFKFVMWRLGHSVSAYSYTPYATKATEL